MNVMRRHVLRLVGIGTVAIAVPQLASAFGSATGASLKLAMGPVSAPAKVNPARRRRLTTPSQRARHLSGHAQSRIIVGDAGAQAPPPGRSDDEVAALI